MVNHVVGTNTSETMNLTAKDYSHLVDVYNKVELWSAYVLIVLSPVTVVTNGVFLFALYRDTFKCFRKTPTIAFIAGLSVADFFTGLLVEPAFAVHYILNYYRPNSRELEITKIIYIVGGTISTVAISTSFVTVLAMSLSQYIAIKYPHKYKSIVTTKRVIRLLVVSGIYFLGFSLIQFTGVSRGKFLLWDVILHPTLISLLIIVVHILIRKAFQQHVARPALSRLDTIRLKEFYPATDSMQSNVQNTPRSKSTTCTVVSEVPHNMVNLPKDCLKNEDNKTLIRTIFKLKSLEANSLRENCVNQDISSSVAEPPQPNRQPSLKRKKAPVEKQFAVMSFYLSAVLLLSSVSHTIVFYVFLLKTPENFEENVYIHIALRVTDVMLFVKVCLDAFIFAWRLPAFRKILMLTLSCGIIKPKKTLV